MFNIWIVFYEKKLTQFLNDAFKLFNILNIYV